jgi:hypothetical protein
MPELTPSVSEGANEYKFYRIDSKRSKSVSELRLSTLYLLLSSAANANGCSGCSSETPSA